MRDFFLHQIYPFQAICGRKAPPPPPQMREIFFTLDLSISGNFQQLWFCFCGRKAPPPPPRMREFIFTLDLSISGNFKQLWFLWQKSPPADDDFHCTRTSTRYERLFAGNDNPSSYRFDQKNTTSYISIKMPLVSCT